MTHPFEPGDAMEAAAKGRVIAHEAGRGQAGSLEGKRHRCYGGTRSRPSVEHGQVVELMMDAVRQAGITRIAVAMKPKER